VPPKETKSTTRVVVSRLNGGKFRGAEYDVNYEAYVETLRTFLADE